MTENWWWPEAVEKAEGIIEEIDIKWDELRIEEDDITNAELTILSEKLAKASYYIVQVNNRLTRLVAVQAASKEMLDHAVNRILASGDDVDGMKPKPAIDARKAAIISNNDRLKETKIEYVEAITAVRALENVKESLDTMWKTTSRILSARFHEPIDR